MKKFKMKKNNRKMIPELKKALSEFKKNIDRFERTMGTKSNTQKENMYSKLEDLDSFFEKIFAIQQTRNIQKNCNKNNNIRHKRFEIKGYFVEHYGGKLHFLGFVDCAREEDVTLSDVMRIIHNNYQVMDCNIHDIKIKSIKQLSNLHSSLQKFKQE